MQGLYELFQYFFLSDIAHIYTFKNLFNLQFQQIYYTNANTESCINSFSIVQEIGFA